MFYLCGLVLYYIRCCWYGHSDSHVYRTATSACSHDQQPHKTIPKRTTATVAITIPWTMQGQFLLTLQTHYSTIFSNSYFSGISILISNVLQIVLSLLLYIYICVLILDTWKIGCSILKSLGNLMIGYISYLWFHYKMTSQWSC